MLKSSTGMIDLNIYRTLRQLYILRRQKELSAPYPRHLLELQAEDARLKKQLRQLLRQRPPTVPAGRITA